MKNYQDESINMFGKLLAGGQSINLTIGKWYKIQPYESKEQKIYLFPKEQFVVLENDFGELVWCNKKYLKLSKEIEHVLEEYDGA